MDQADEDPLTLCQRMMGLPETGTVDDATMAMMRKPRCGNKDLEMMRQQNTRRKRYAFFGEHPRMNACVIYGITNEFHSR